MHFTTIAVLLSTATVFAAPLTERADCACSTAEKFVNSGFDGTAKEWYLTKQTGTGTAAGGPQTKYYPTSWPFNGQPQAYALTINMPANSNKSVRLEQTISNGIKNNANYAMSFAYYLQAAGSAGTTSCTFTSYAGSDPTQPIVNPLLVTGGPAPAPSSVNWASISDTIVGNNPGSPVQANIAGGILTCYTGNAAADLTFYIDGFSLKEKC